MQAVPQDIGLGHSELADSRPSAQDLSTGSRRWIALEGTTQLSQEKIDGILAEARAAAERFRRIASAYQRLSAGRKEQGAEAEDLQRLGDDPRIRSLPPQELALRLRHSSSVEVRAASALLLSRKEGQETRRALRAAWPPA
jgi:hypothetical protein